MTLKVDRIGSRVWQQPMGMIVDSYVLRDPAKDQFATEPWILNPPFQRGAVWTLKQKRRWIETLLNGFALPSIIINQFPAGHPDYGFANIVIDGQQRLRATADFMRDKFKVRGESYGEQSAAFKRGWIMAGTNTPIVLCKFETLKECAELYIKLLTAGTAHTTDEIKKAKQYIKGCK